MSQENLLMYFVGFILAIFTLRLIRFTITWFFVIVEDTILDVFPKYEGGFGGFFSKVDFLVNKMRILNIRWHFIVAFGYVVYIAAH
jgi:hypothetical protein